MRIIAGTYGSIKLESLEGDNTRPTLDKVKEAIFSSVGGYFDGGKVLDLFAGSGSLGLECLSRGMDEAYFCDKNSKAIEIIKSNINKLKVNNCSTIYKGDYKNALLKFKDLKFDFIYIDPPYALKVHDEIMSFISNNNMLNNNGVIIIESDSKDIFSDNYDNIEKYKEKTYRITRLSYYRLGGNK